MTIPRKYLKADQKSSCPAAECSVPHSRKFSCTLMILLPLAATVAIYCQMFAHEFIYNWDDALYVSENSVIREITGRTLREIFTTYYVGNYAPVQMFSYMLDYQAWGMMPGGFLLTNLLLHCCNGLLLSVLVYSLMKERLAALVAAAVASGFIADPYFQSSTGGSSPLPI